MKKICDTRVNDLEWNQSGRRLGVEAIVGASTQANTHARACARAHRCRPSCRGSPGPRPHEGPPHVRLLSQWLAFPAHRVGSAAFAIVSWSCWGRRLPPGPCPKTARSGGTSSLHSVFLEQESGAPLQETRPLDGRNKAAGQILRTKPKNLPLNTATSLNTLSLNTATRP